MGRIKQSFQRGERSWWKVIRRLLILAVLLWLGWLALKAHYYQDVSTCFKKGNGSVADTIYYITIHHDAIPQDKEVDLADIDKFHSEIRKWSCGFAYHYYITKNKIFKISFDKQSRAHVANNNRYNIGICLHGDFDHEQPTLQQQFLLICLVNKLVINYKIKFENIKRHRDWDGQNGTHCCGEQFNFEGFTKYLVRYE